MYKVTHIVLSIIAKGWKLFKSLNQGNTLKKKKKKKDTKRPLQGLPKQNITDWVTETKLIYFLTILEARNPNLLAGLFFLRPLSDLQMATFFVPIFCTILKHCFCKVTKNRMNSTHPKIQSIVKSNRPCEISTSLHYINPPKGLIQCYYRYFFQLWTKTKKERQTHIRDNHMQ